MCLFISLIAWAGIKLSENYEVEYNLPISFFNSSETEMVSSQSHWVLSYKLQASGILNILHKLNRKVDTLFVDIEKLPRITRSNSTWAFATKDDLRNEISRLFASGYKVAGVIPDTVFALVGKAYEKMVPVRVVTKLSFAKGFGAFGSFVCTPDSVLVKGPRSIVDTLSAIETMVVRLSDLSTPTIHTTALHSPVNLGLLQVSPSRVEVSIGVEEVKEITFELPVEVRYSDTPIGKQLKIKIVPEKVKVICLVPLRTFLAFDQSFINAYVVVWGSKEASGNLEVVVESSFQDVKILGVVPSIVESVVLNNF